MPSIARRRPRAVRLTLTVAVALALTAAVGVASGAIPSAGGKIDGCFAKDTGRLRVIDKAKGQSCPGREQALS